MFKALNKNQILLLKKIKTNSKFTITALIETVSRENKVPVSTLKLNAKILKNLGLIEFGNSHGVKLTSSGVLILNLMGCDL